MLISRIHSRGVMPRRRRILAERIAPLIPEGSSVLDVGTGDGAVAAAIRESGRGLTVTGIDVLVREGAAIPVTRFDGVTIPYADGSHDVVLFVDVLHHTRDPQALLNEAARVARRCVIVKDHDRNGPLAGPTLRLMDWVGNARFGVALPYNYWSAQQWAAGYGKAGLRVLTRQTRIGLYPPWADWLFGRGLQSIAVLQKVAPRSG